MFDVIARVLAFFYSLPVVGGSYGLAIIFLTAAVMILLMPLTIRATRSTIKMQEVQPKLKELQKKYKDDKPTLNAELMELYKTEGINPVGGCLPMLAQLPVFLVLFRVLQGLSRRVSETPFFAIADHARVAVGSSALPSHTFDPKYLATNSAMSRDLHGSTTMPFGPFDLAEQPIDALQANLLRGIPYFLLILFVVGTSFYQQRQITARRTSGAPLMNPQQEMIMKFLPLMSGIWSFAFPAGLVLYWATSNVFRIAQQTYITRAFYGDLDSSDTKDAPDNDKKASADGPVDPVSDAKTSGDDKPGSDKGRTSGPGSANGRSPRTRSGPQAPAKSGDGAEVSASGDKGANGLNGSNGGHGDSSDNDTVRGKIGDLDREQAWAKRRHEKARVQAANKNRSEQSTRVTPKGTKPSDSKRKRKR